VYGQIFGTESLSETWEGGNVPDLVGVHALSGLIRLAEGVSSDLEDG
jgi:hypothetical protein